MISFTIPLKTKNTSNQREHFRARAARLKRERAAAMAKCPRWTGVPLLHVTLTRVGPRELDSDGVQSALKAVRDGVAARLRIDDGSPLIRWEYAQAKGEAEVRVVIEHVGTLRPLPPEVALSIRRMLTPFSEPDDDRETHDDTVRR